MSHTLVSHQALALLVLALAGNSVWLANAAGAATPNPAAATTSHAAAASGRAASSKPATPAQRPIHAIEQALEVTMDQIRLPDAATGPLMIDPCARCLAKSLTLDAQSLIYLDDKLVSLDVLRLRLKLHSKLVATALYAPADMRLTRLLVVSR